METNNESLSTKKKHTEWGKASLSLGVIAMVLSLFTYTPGYGYSSWIIGPFLFLFVVFPLGILAIIFGLIGYWRKKLRDEYGLYGFLLGVIGFLIGFILVTAQTYFTSWGI